MNKNSIYCSWDIMCVCSWILLYLCALIVFWFVNLWTGYDFWMESWDIGHVKGRGTEWENKQVKLVSVSTSFFEVESCFMRLQSIWSLLCQMCLMYLTSYKMKYRVNSAKVFGFLLSCLPWNFNLPFQNVISAYFI